MNIEEALHYADEWTEGYNFSARNNGWRVVCKTLADEVRFLNALLHEMGYTEADYDQLERIAGLVKDIEIEEELNAVQQRDMLVSECRKALAESELVQRGDQQFLLIPYSFTRSSAFKYD